MHYRKHPDGPSRQQWRRGIGSFAILDADEKRWEAANPKGDLAAAIKSAFGSFADFQSKLAAAGVAALAPAWAWLW